MFRIWFSVYLTKKDALGQRVPLDQDLWKQCHSCGEAVPIYEANKEGKLQDFVQPSTNPFNGGKSITGLNNKVK